MVKQKMKLLIIDDEKDICSFMKSVLAKRGFAVYTAQTGARAIPLAKRVKPDMALIDIHMPRGESGIEILQKLLKVNPECKCIMTSWDKTRALQAKKLGASGVLIKPAQIEDLEKVVSKAAQKLITTRCRHV
jgi:DNA-binding NtrC family response regulator